MNFPDEIPEDDMQLLLKEWPLTGGTVIGTSTLVAFLVRNEEAYLACWGRLYGKDDGKWVSSVAVVTEDGCMSAPGKMCPLGSQCTAKDKEYGYFTSSDR